MARYPGSKQSALMREKEVLARQLLARGLTVTQVSGQLNCSKNFVRRILRESAQTGETATGESVIETPRHDPTQSAPR